MLSKGHNSIFLESLLVILNESVHQDTISWSSDGESFIIHDLKLFTEKILPNHFKHKNFSSFHRQLNLYGFVRDQKIVNGKAFKHPFFIRNRPDLLHNIHKKQKKSSLQLMLKKVSPASRFLFIYNATKDLSGKNLKIGQNLNQLNEKVDELIAQNKIIVEKNNSSTQDLEKAKNILIYFANWFKNRQSRYNYWSGNRSQDESNDGIEEITEIKSPERLTYYPNDDFFV